MGKRMLPDRAACLVTTAISCFVVRDRCSGQTNIEHISLQQRRCARSRRHDSCIDGIDVGSSELMSELVRLSRVISTHIVRETHKASGLRAEAEIQ